MIIYINRTNIYSKIKFCLFPFCLFVYKISPIIEFQLEISLHFLPPPSFFLGLCILRSIFIFWIYDRFFFSFLIQGSNPMGEAIPEEGWVVCRVFRKKNYQKTLESPKGSSSSILDSKAHQILGSGNDGVLDQILFYMGRSCKMENESFNNSANNSLRFLTNNSNITEGLHERFMHLPRLDSPTLPSIPISSPSFDQDGSFKSCYDHHQSYDEMLTTENHEPSSPNQGSGTNFEMTSSVHDSSKSAGQLNDWVTLDRLVASQLNGHDPNASFGLSPDDDMQLSHLQNSHRSSSNHLQDNSNSHVVYSNENDLWTFTKSSSSPSSSDPLCHLSV